jgi:hypothetical protein
MVSGAVQVIRRLRAAGRSLDRPGAPGAASEITTLSGAARRFVTHPRPPFLLGTVAALAAARVVRGRAGPGDLRVALACAAAQPFLEWTVHRGLLHVRPNGPISDACYRSFGSGHERHHADPTNVDSMFLRPQDVLRVGAAALTVAVVGPPRAATGALCLGLSGLAYDWTHFLIHTGYQPRSRLYRRMWRTHRLHHFRNERYWLGVTSPIADIVLRTNPARDAVPISRSAVRPVGHQPGSPRPSSATRVAARVSADADAALGHPA